MRFHLAVAADEAFASLGVDMPALPSRIHRPLGLVAAQPMEPCQVAGAYRASGMELRSQSAAVAGSATALHVASLPPLTLLAPDQDPPCLCLFVSFSHGAATASHCRRGPLFGLALQMPSPVLAMQTWSCSAWPDIDNNAGALAGTGYLLSASQRASLVVPDTP